MNAASIRTVFRWVHLVLAIALGAYFYSSLRSDPFWTDVMRFLIFPMFAITGLGMWQQGRINRFLRRKS